METEKNFIGPIMDKLINSVIIEIKKEKNKKKIMDNIIGPILNDINKTYYPYAITLMTLLLIIIILLILVLITFVGEKNKYN